MFTMDGVEWSLPGDITRKFDIHDTDISGRMMNGQIFHDVDGTYLEYEITVCPNPRQMGDYYSLLAMLSRPVDGHVFVLPYDNGTIEITAKVEAPRDVWVRLPGGQVYWKGMRFTVTANGPTYAEALDDTISRGMTPLPDVYDAEIGDTYTMTANGWEKTSALPDADSMAF